MTLKGMDGASVSFTLQSLRGLGPQVEPSRGELSRLRNLRNGSLPSLSAEPCPLQSGNGGDSVVWWFPDLALGL